MEGVREGVWNQRLWRCCWRRRKERTRERESITFIKGRKRKSGMLKQSEGVPRRCITQSQEVAQQRGWWVGVGGRER